MRLDIHLSKDKLEAEFGDRLTSSDLGEFRDLLAQIRQAGRKSVVLDLSNLNWIDSAGLGMLILAKETADKAELDLVLRSPRGHVRSLLELGRFDKLFTIEA